MGQSPVVVNKRGFLSTLAMSIATVVSVTIICASSVAIYGLTIVDNRTRDLISMSPDAMTALLQWQDSLPPAVKDAITDIRSPEYQDQIDVDRIVGVAPLEYQ